MPTVPNPMAIADLQLPHTRVDYVVPGFDGFKTDVQLTLARPGEDEVTIWIALPFEWNGRFQGLGGGGFLAGWPGALDGAVREGFAAASTDGGHKTSSADFALNPDGTPNRTGITNFGHRAIHDMTVAAKAVIELFYGEPPHHSYFVGCSTGGRQGIMEAQRYPDDYDGVLAGCPVINFDRLQIGQFWGQLVMLMEDNPISEAKFEAARAAIIEELDADSDGIVDGIIGTPFATRPDFDRLVGLATDDGPLTDTDAAIIRSIVDGPRRRDGEFLWYGVAPGASFQELNDTVKTGDRLEGKPFEFDPWWVKYFLARDPNWDWHTLTYETFEAFFDQSVREYADVLASDDPDLGPFTDRGGKLLMWHGGVDGGVPYQGSLEYYERVSARIGPEATDSSVRLFVAPGVGHCAGGPGPQPVGMLEDLIAWVEEGTTPDVIRSERTNADGSLVAARPIFPYPDVAKWDGTSPAESFDAYVRTEGKRITPSRP